MTVKPELFFGYKLVMLPNGVGGIGQPQQAWQIAYPEKALLDLLYLYPFYDNENELEQLRLDENFMTTDLDMDRLRKYQQRMAVNALDTRIKKLLKLYDIND